MLLGDPILGSFSGLPRGVILGLILGRFGESFWVSFWGAVGTGSGLIWGVDELDLGVDLRLDSDLCEYMYVRLCLSLLSRSLALSLLRARSLSLARALWLSLSLGPPRKVCAHSFNSGSLSRACGRPRPRLLPDLRELPLHPLHTAH